MKKDGHVEDIDLMSNKPNHSMDLLAVQETSIAPQIVDIPHIDFIFENQQWIIKDQDLLVHMQQLKHLMVRSQIQEKCKHQKKQYLQSASNWRKKSCQVPKLFHEYEDQELRKFVRLIFDPGGHLQNSRSSSLQSGGKLMQARPMVCQLIGPGPQAQ